MKQTIKSKQFKSITKKLPISKELPSKEKTVECLPEITTEIQLEKGFNSILNHEMNTEYKGKLQDLHEKSIQEIMDIDSANQLEKNEMLSHVLHYMKDSQYSLTNVYMNTVLAQIDGYVRIYKKELGIRLYNYILENSSSVISEYIKSNSDKYYNVFKICDSAYNNESLVNMYNIYLSSMVYDTMPNGSFSFIKYLPLFEKINNIITDISKSIEPLEITSISEIIDIANLHASIIYNDVLQIYTDNCMDIHNEISRYNRDTDRYEYVNKLDMNEFINMIKLLYLSGEEYINTTVSLSLIPELIKMYATILHQVYNLYHPLGMAQEYHDVQQLIVWSDEDY